MKTCPICTKPIPKDLRADSVYCSDNCRKLAYEYRSGRIFTRKRRLVFKDGLQILKERENEIQTN